MPAVARFVLAWLAATALASLVELWRVGVGAPGAIGVLLLLIVPVTAAWTAAAAGVAFPLVALGRRLAAREPVWAVWVGPVVGGCLAAGETLHRWEARTFVRHDLAVAFTPLLELAAYAAIVGAAVLLHGLLRARLVRLPRRALLAAAGALALGVLLVPALRFPAVLEHGLVGPALLVIVATAVAAGVVAAPPAALRWRPGRRTLAIVVGVEAVLLVLAALGGRLAPVQYPAASAGLQARGVVAPRAIAALARASDRDGDGFAALFGGIDCDDGDARIHPFARDLPGDGVDQDCFEGDLSPSAVEADLAARAAARARPPRARAQSVVLVTLDTARADAFGFAGGPPTPAIDALAARGAAFTRAYSAAPMTRKAFPALLASRSPSRLEWLDLESKYPYPVAHDDNRFLAEALTDAGITTGHVVAFNYAKNSRFDQGFQQKVVLAASRAEHEWNADQIVDRAIGLVERWAGGGTRFFLWVHFYEAHYPYVAHPGLERGAGDKGRYLSEIAWIDSQLARLVDAVDRTGLAGTTALVVTGDHGEEFGEHGSIRHRDLYIEDLQVPLVIVGPGIAAQRIDTPTSLLDVAPTIAELLGVPVPPEFDGESLVGWLEGAPPPADRHVAAEMIPDRKVPRRLLTLIGPRWQLIADLELGGRELHDLSKDRFGTRNLVGDEPAVAREMEVRLRRHLALRLGSARVRRAGEAAPDEPVEPDDADDADD